MTKQRPPHENDDALALEVAEQCLASKLRLINRAVGAVYDEALRPFELKIGQVNVLVAISLFGEVRPSDLGRALAMDKSTLSRTLERLEARGWVQQAPADEDARAHRLRVTAAGRAVLRKAYPAWQRAQEEVRALLGDRCATLHEVAEELRARSLARD